MNDARGKSTEDCTANIGTFTTNASGAFGPVSVTVRQNITAEGVPRVCSASQPCSLFAAMNAQPQNAHEPITFLDTTPPTCTYTRVASNPKRIDFVVRDTGQGMAPISFTTAVNILPPVFPLFTHGTNDPISFSAVRDNQAVSSQVAVVITDVQGNKASCI
jgi:hypothetical protein